MALVAVGLMVGCGGDTAGTVKKSETKVTTPGGGSTKVEKKEETKTTTTPEKK